MANVIELRDSTNTKCYPLTKAQAVYFDDGSDVDAVRNETSEIVQAMTDGTIILSDTLVATTAAETKWFDNFIPASVTEFNIRIGDVTGRKGTPEYVARVQVYYTDGWNTIAGYIDQTNTTFHIKASEEYIVQRWSLVVYTAASAQSASFTTKWPVSVWQDGAKEPYPLGFIENLISNSNRSDTSPSFYGPVTTEYTAKTTTENWQRLSYAFIDNVLTNGKKYCYAIILSRHGLGLRAGVINFYDSTSAAESAYTSTAAINLESYDCGPCITRIDIPLGAVKLRAQFEGISNATTAGTPSVIGETYFVKDCYIYLSDEAIGVDDVSSLTTQWQTAIDNIRMSQGTSFCFGIQTDTHFASTYPLYVGKQLKEATKYVGFDFIANLGDITRGYEGSSYPDNPTNMRAYAKEIMKRYTDGVQCPFFVCVGNHESNIMWANAHSSDPKFTLAELYAQYTKQSLNTSAKIVSKPGKSYYYADLDFARVIVLFTNDSETGSFTVSNDQVAWFTNEALNTTKPVLILSHVPLINGWNPDDLNYSSDYAKIMTPLVAFKNNGGTVIACLYGHAHRQESQKVNGIWHIICTKSENQFETAELFMVNINTFNITTIGIGAAESRSFTH